MTDAGASGVAARFFDVLFRVLERRLGVLDRRLLFLEDLLEERRLGVLERRFEED